MPVRNINGIELNYYERGDNSKPTIVFVHPVLFDSTVFDPLVSELENDFHLVLLDIHGHGESGYRSLSTLEEMTTDCHQLLLELNLSKVIWVGYSIGGMIGMRLAIQHPEVIESLIVLATMARLDSPQIREQTWWLWQMLRAGHREDIVDAALRFFFSPSTFSSQPRLVANYRDKIMNYSHAQAKGMFEVARAVLNRTDISDQLSAIKTPTLVITGKDDLAPTPADMESIASAIPKAEFAVVDESSHLLAVEKPREVAEIFYDFLKIHKFVRRDLDGGNQRERGQRRNLNNSIQGVKQVATLNSEMLSNALPLHSDMSVC
jgi:pimeloyl-ACP methyl ester carboxylesterase